MAGRKPNPDPNESLEAQVERELKESQLRRAEEEGRETPKRRRSPFATVARSARRDPSPIPTPAPIPHSTFREQPDFEENPARARFSEEPSGRKFVEEAQKPQRPREEPEPEINGENWCISVMLAVVSIAALVVIFAYSFLATKEVK